MMTFPKLPASVLVIFVFALAVLPNLTVRSFVWEEGRNAELARDILVRGDLLEPLLYGQRWVEKPSLLPWLIAGVARLTGGVNEWSARLPAMTAVVLTALVVFQFTRRFASERAALFAAGCFIFCPLLLRKLTVAEPDTIITALVFGAFVIWWQGTNERIGIARVLACGMLLAIAAMAKGPQPLAYFAIGIGGYAVMRKRWGELVKLIVVLILPVVAVFAWAYAVYRPGDLPVWLDYMRFTPRMKVASYLIERVRFSGILLIDLLPAILFVPFFWRQRQRLDKEKRRLWEMLFWYAGAVTLLLFFWPGANTRYAMPAAPAVAVMAGLVIDDLWQRSRIAVQLAVAILAALMVYQFALVWIALPVFAARFGASRAAGLAIARAVGRSEPVFNVGQPNSNQLFYASRPIRWIGREETLQLRPPAWLVLVPGELEWLKAHHPSYSFGQVVRTTSGPNLIAVEIGELP